ncbi:MAG: DUF3422 domain-containing protein [Betaproteobacteria bacterium]|jgi:uncharacterized membrane-anchored protein|nr:DUF3422 domain-containing protein [Betaproteobacteria bacterium]NDF63609.1 DUF3422 domain-containing protein [Betaproteobacteria bacterium]
MQDHLQRLALHNEVHARPPEPVGVPMVISHVVMGIDRESRQASRSHLVQLLRNHHLAIPEETTTHLRADFGSWRLRWELHTEFVTWTFMREGDPGVPGIEPESALQAVPQAWLSNLPGACLARIHVWAMAHTDSSADWVSRYLHEETLVASRVANDHATVYTDFQLHPDGFSRIVLFSDALPPRQLGRLIQQLLEIESYRMAALLGLPAARDAGTVLADAERELAELAQAIRSAQREEEAGLLDRLTRLAGQVEGQYAASHSRFSASRAYFELVDQRIRDIRESRLDGMQTIGEFMERRLTPARSTCDWAVRRQTALSERVSRMSNLLRTRVEIEQQQSSQELLATMNRRQGLQLQLQSTVEGLSVAAITYYIVGLVNYTADGLSRLGWPWGVEITTAASVPVVTLLVWLFIRHLHNKLSKH